MTVAFTALCTNISTTTTTNASQSFICRCCTVDRPITDGLNTDLHLDNGNGVSLEKVDKFCYLGDKLGYWHQRADESDGNPPPR